MSRPRKLDDKVVHRMRRSGMPVTQIAEWFGVTRGAIHVSLRRAQGQTTSPQERINELEAALEALRLPDGHFSVRCQPGRCVLVCRTALRVLG